MKASDFRAAAGNERSRIVATSCGYTPDYWRQACASGATIAPDRLTCMLNALETLARADLAFVRAARKHIKQETP